MLELILIAAIGQVDMAAHTQRMIDAQPPSAAALREGDDPAVVVFTPYGDGYVMTLQHSTTVCCVESYVATPDSFDWWYYPQVPGAMPLFVPGYRVLDLPPDHALYPECDEQGQQYASYPLGDMEDAYSGPLGDWEGPRPVDLGHNDGCVTGSNNDDLIVWSGLTPSTPVEVTIVFTCAGDFDGDGTVGTLDVLKVLEYWDDPDDPDDWGFGNTHFLAIVGNWGDCE